MTMTHVAGSFISWWTFGLFHLFGCDEQWFCELTCECFCGHTFLSLGYTPRSRILSHIAPLYLIFWRSGRTMKNEIKSAVNNLCCNIKTKWPPHFTFISTSNIWRLQFLQILASTYCIFFITATLVSGKYISLWLWSAFP